MNYPYIEWMVRRDVTAVCEIEQMLYTDPWTDEDICFHLRRRDTIGMVAKVKSEGGEIVAGYMVYVLHREHLYLKRFGVHPAWNERGIAEAMIEKLQSKLSSHRRARVVADVPDCDLPMQQFLRKMGFKAICVLHGVNGDAYRMVYRYGEVEAEAVNRVANYMEDLP